MNVLGVAVEWYHGYKNPAELHLLLDERPPEPEAWEVLPTAGGHYYVARREPVTDFLFEDERERSGQSERTLALADGSTRAVRGYWYTGAAALNRLRAESPAAVALLPCDVADATYHVGAWGAVGTACRAWDAPWLAGQVDRCLSEVELVAIEVPVRDGLTTEQARIVGAVAGGPRARDYAPRLRGTWAKPESGSMLDLATSAEAARGGSRLP